MDKLTSKQRDKLQEKLTQKQLKELYEKGEKVPEEILQVLGDEGEEPIEVDAEVIGINTDAKYVLMERRDEEQIMRAMAGELLEEYVYHFKHRIKDKTGKIKVIEVTGLSWAGVKEASRKDGDYETEIIDINETEEAYRMIVKATKIVRDPLDPEKIIKKDSRLGASQQKKLFKSGLEDEFAYTKCLSKAQRNALRALIPETIIAGLIKEYLKRLKR